MWPLPVKPHLNFYRIHLLCFILVPLLAAVILWASNGRFKVGFTDALYICVSAVTGTGLSTVDLSSLTAWQQVILFVLELAGNQVFVSWIVVFIRRAYFREHLGHVVAAELERTNTRRETLRDERSAPRGARVGFGVRDFGHIEAEHKRTKLSQLRAIRPDMVQRLDVEPRPVDPMGNLSRAQTFTSAIHDAALSDAVRRRLVQVQQAAAASERLPAHQEVGFGGFPGPPELLLRTSRRLLPGLHGSLQRTLTMPRTTTLIPPHVDPAAAAQPDAPTQEAPYFSSPFVVRKNSGFPDLTEEQLLELGGVEYRALNALLWIVPLYYFGILILAMIVLTPYMALPQWRSIFKPPQQHRKISPVWFSIFQVAGAWSNTGLSLVDQSMVPFRTAYLMIVVLIFCVLAGNTAFPVFFRFTIWTLSKLFPRGSRNKDSLQFLLDHPRRCFITLFPSPQTWLLFFVLCIMNFVLFGGELVLNIGNAATDAIPIGTRVALAFLSSAAVRSAGFQGVAISSLTPATQVLYLVMMYIAVYPVAMSVRATNVYEESSLGIYPEDENKEDEAVDLQDTRVAIWGKHFMRHVRRQLSFDMWWLALTVFLLSVIERHSLMDTTKSTWFNLFAILFETVSAYGTVGLSLGTPFTNDSLSGVFHKPSKILVCAVMLRGRHRGLPVALDRAVMLPHEFRKQPAQPVEVQLPENAEPASQVTEESVTTVESSTEGSTSMPTPTPTPQRTME